MKSDKYTIEDLIELTGYHRRTIRYYVQKGLIEPPAGRGRGGFYNDSHVQSLLRIRALREKGMGILAIAPLLKKETLEPILPSREVMIRYEIVPGIEINISRETEIMESKKILEIIRIAKAIAKGDMENE